MPAQKLLIKAILKLVKESDLKESGVKKVEVRLECGRVVEVLIKVDAINGILRLVQND